MVEPNRDAPQPRASRLKLPFFATMALLGPIACSTTGEGAATSASAVAPLPDPVAWTTYRDPDGVFEARFPDAPTVSKEDTPPKKPGDLHLVATSARFSDEARLLSAAVIDLEVSGGYDCERGLASMAKVSLTGMGCTEVRGEVVSFHGLPGREVTFTCQKRPMRGIMLSGCDAREKGRVHAYSLLAAMMETSWSDTEAKAFLQGFTLLRK